MKRRNLLRYVVYMILCSIGVGPVCGVTITLVDGDPCTIMGSLIDGDGDQVSKLATAHGGTFSKPYISTTFPVTVRYAHPRRAIAEFALEPLKIVSTEPNAVTSATLHFYFDDVIFPDDSAAPWRATKDSKPAACCRNSIWTAATNG